MGSGKMKSIRLTDLVYKKPSDGIPLYQSWKTLAMDIFYGGFEPLREPLQARISTDGSLECVKGLGRLSILFFGSLWTFLKKDQLTEEQRLDFCRRTIQQVLRFQSISQQDLVPDLLNGWNA